MTPNSPQSTEVKAALDKLIHSVSNEQFEILDAIYHQSMKIYMLDGNDDLTQMDKTGFMNHVSEATKSAEEPHTWAKYHLVEADETNGHVIISRRVNLTGELQTITLSIDFVFEDGRWQITREIIFAGVIK